jgi:hypothetical protein
MAITTPLIAAATRNPTPSGSAKLLIVEIRLRITAIPPPNAAYLIALSEI